MSTSTLILILVVLVLFMYIQHYNNFKNDFKIIQVTLENVDAKQLYEKYPILIYDRVVDPETLLTSLFAYIHTRRKYMLIPGGEQIYFNPCKYTMLYSPIADSEIQLIMPKYRKELTFHRERELWKSKEGLSETQVQYVTVKLKKQQILILPTFWMFQSPHPLRGICLDDPFSALVNFFHSRTRTVG